MIVPMKKVHVVVGTKDATSALEKLGVLGAVHIEHLSEIKGHSLIKQQDEIRLLENVIVALSQEKSSAVQEVCDHPKKSAAQVQEMIDELQRLRAVTARRASHIQKWEPWGSFNPQDIQDLAEQNIFIQLFVIPAAELAKMPANVVCEVIRKESGLAYCVVVSRENIALSFERIVLPLASLQAEKDIQEKELALQRELEAKIKTSAKYLGSFKEALQTCYEELKFHQARLGMKEEESLCVLKGYCPKTMTDVLKEAAKGAKWGILIEDPSGDDQVPTLIKNPKWIDIVKPVFGVINVLPGYKELDISLIFLIFFSVFFGILIGDAGYGLVFLGLTIFAQNKLKNKVTDKSPFILMYVLSACTILWGVLTGTFFGTLLLGHTIKPMIGWLTDIKNVQLLCFLIGALHLSIAHMWKLINRFPSFAALAEFGWVIVIWGGFFAAAMMILGVKAIGGVDIFTIVKILMAGGAALVVIDILTQDKKTIFVNLILFIFGCISAFTDVVSYVRLFAVGLAGVAVADAFNQMALGFGFNGVVTGLITALILVVGHMFNMVLCGFGILVHGLRLNVLEFSGHLGLEWAGFKYDPFKKITHVKLQS